VEHAREMAESVARIDWADPGVMFIEAFDRAMAEGPSTMAR